MTRSPKQRELYMAIGMRHAFHFALAYISIGDIRRTRERGTLSQHLAEWSSPIQFDTRKNIFIYWIEPGAHRKVFKKNNNLFKQVKPWGKLGPFFIFRNELLTRIELRYKLRYQICFQNWTKWIESWDKPWYQICFQNWTKWIESQDKPRYRIYFQEWTFKANRALR